MTPSDPSDPSDPSADFTELGERRVQQCIDSVAMQNERRPGLARRVALELLRRFPLEDPQEAARAGTMIGSLASGFAGDDPLRDAGAFQVARRTWKKLDLVALDHQALVLGSPLGPIDRRRVGLAWYERAELGRALLGMRDAGDELGRCAGDLAGAAQASGTRAFHGEAAAVVAAFARYAAVRQSLFSEPPAPPAGGER